MPTGTEEERVVILENNGSMRSDLEQHIKVLGFTPISIGNRQQCTEITDAFDPYAIILNPDVRLTEEGKIEKDTGIFLALDILRKNPSQLVGIHTYAGKDRKIVTAEGAGAVYLPKPARQIDIYHFLNRMNI